MMEDVARAAKRAPPTRTGRSAPTKKDERRARKVIKEDGEDGYATAARLIGADAADKLLLPIVAKSIGLQPEDWTAKQAVAGIRRRKGF